jgi:hypothetical protein
VQAMNSEKNDKFRVFSVAETDAFKRLEDLDIVVDVPPEFAIDVFCSS